MTLSDISESILLARNVLETSLRKEQTDHMKTMRKIIFHTPVYVLFVNFKHAFDSLEFNSYTGRKV